MLYEIDAAFRQAVADDAVKVIVLAAEECQWNALQQAFALHHLGHAHARILHGIPVEPSGMDVIRNDAKTTGTGG